MLRKCLFRDNNSPGIFHTLKVICPSHTFCALHCDWLIKVKGMLCECEQMLGVNIGSDISGHIKNFCEGGWSFHEEVNSKSQTNIAEILKWLFNWKCLPEKVFFFGVPLTFAQRLTSFLSQFLNRSADNVARFLFTSQIVSITKRNLRVSVFVVVLEYITVYMKIVFISLEYWL